MSGVLHLPYYTTDHAHSTDTTVSLTSREPLIRVDGISYDLSPSASVLVPLSPPRLPLHDIGVGGALGASSEGMWGGS